MPLCSACLIVCPLLPGHIAHYRSFKLYIITDMRIPPKGDGFGLPKPVHTFHNLPILLKNSSNTKRKAADGSDEEMVTVAPKKLKQVGSGKPHTIAESNLQLIFGCCIIYA